MSDTGASFDLDAVQEAIRDWAEERHASIERANAEASKLFREIAANMNSTFLAVLNFIVTSEEFSQRDVPDSVFITMLYKALLDRLPDEPGLAHHTTSLANGADRMETTNDFYMSRKFEEHCFSLGINPY